MQGWELERGLVTASAEITAGGSTGCGIKHAHVIVFVSEHASVNKIQAMRAWR
jgi:hypothetical protein